MATEYSYDFQNSVRSLDEVFRTIITKMPALISFIGFVGADGSIPQGVSLAAPEGMCTNTKHEWLEDSITPKTTTLNNSGAIANTDTTFDVTDGTVFTTGDVIRFESSTVTYDEVMRITNISTNTLTVDRGTGTGAGAGYGGTTRETSIADGSNVIRIAKPINESTDASRNAQNQEPSAAYNYTMILEEEAKVSKTAQNVQWYGIENMLNYQVNVGLANLAWQMNDALVNGRRIQRTSSIPGMAGGLDQYITNSVDGAGATLTADTLNDAIEQTMLLGGLPKIMVMNTNQSRILSSFDQDAIRLVRDDRTRGQAVYRWVSDIPIPGGTIDTFIVDMNMRKDTIYLVDPTRVAVVPMQGRSFQDMDSTLPGGDYFSRRILGEYTFVIKNGANSHCKITNLSFT